MESESQEKKLVGFEIEEKDIDLKDGELVGKVVGKHVGKLGFLKVTVEGGFSAKPLLSKGIDWLEKKIPGDQTAWASLAKSAIDKIKL